MVELEFQQKTKELIDSLKNICAHYGLGNDGMNLKSYPNLPVQVSQR